MSRELEAEIEVATGGDELTAVRELVLRAHPDVVPELVTGSTVAALLSSIEPAQAAYGRLAETIQSGSRPAAPVPSAPTFPPAPSVPAGGSAPVPADPDRQYHRPDLHRQPER